MISPIHKYKQIDRNYVFKRKFKKGLEVALSRDESVKRDAVLATGEVSGVKSRLDLASTLGVKSLDVQKYLLCIQGERINRGDAIAFRRSGVLKKEVRVQAPSSGIVSLTQIKEGILKILDFAKESTISVGVGGRVVSVIRNKYVSIRTEVVKVFPFEVLGRSIQGEILFVKDGRNEEVENLNGSIVIIESTNVDLGFLRNLEMNGAKGVILGGLPFSIYQDFRKKSSAYFTLCLLEGFGDLTINPKLIDLLRKNDGYLAQLDSRSNELFLTFTKGAETESDDRIVTRLRKKMTVKIFDDQFWGEYGQIQEILGEYAKVQIAKNRIVDINVNNLFVII
ncbi:MAG: hypothetical protein ABIE03_00735 [Patescibacteria group bacterium]|nr:hypothetical protein [Patescibacteria group bacterium]